MTARTIRFIAIFMLTLALLVCITACDGSDGNIKPAPPESLRDSRVASIEGLTIHLTDGTHVKLPAATPRSLLKVPGLTPIHASAYPDGAMVQFICADPPIDLAEVLDEFITDEGWQDVESNDTPTYVTHIYRKGNAMMEITSRTELQLTHVTLHIESIEPSGLTDINGD